MSAAVEVWGVPRLSVAMNAVYWRASDLSDVVRAGRAQLRWVAAAPPTKVTGSTDLVWWLWNGQGEPELCWKRNGGTTERG
jgi:hypothetical protein